MAVDVMRELFGSAWAYYVAFVILFVWWGIYRRVRK